MSKVLKIVGYLLVAIALIVDCGWAYISYYDLKPSVTKTVYIGEQLDNLDNKVAFMQINDRDTDCGYGRKGYEVKFNYYTDYTCNTLKSYIVQSLGAENTNFGGEYFDGLFFYDELGVSKSCYYDNFNNTSWKSTKLLDESDYMYIKINDEVYAVRLEGYYTTKDLWQQIFGGSTKHYYSFIDLVSKLCKTISESNMGYQQYDLPIVNLSEYFVVYKFNNETKQLDRLDKASDTTIVYDYIYMSVNKSHIGMLTANDSLAGMVDGKNDYIWEGYKC